MVATKPKGVDKVIEILDREYQFYLRWFYISEEMEQDEEKEDVKSVLREFKRLRRFETREQWAMSVSKLKSAINVIIQYYPLKVQNEINKHVQDMERLEGRILIDTANDLLEGLKKKPIDWKEVNRITKEIIHFLRALTYVDRETKKLVEG